MSDPFSDWMDRVENDPWMTEGRKRFGEPSEEEKQAAEEQGKLMWIEPKEGESYFQACTRRIRENVVAEASANIIAGKLMAQVLREGYWKQTHASFDDYLAAEMPAMDPSWAAVLMEVGGAFDLYEARKYGITPLSELLKLRREAFKTMGPDQLLVERHVFKDASGAECVLEFQVDHSVRHLKALVAAARRARLAREGTPETMSDAAKKLSAALKVAVEQVGGVRWELDERRGEAKLDLRGPVEKLAEVLRKV